MSKKGINYNNTTRTFMPRRGMEAIDAVTGDAYKLDNAADVEVLDYVTGPDGKHYLSAKVTYFADYPQDKNPHKENVLQMNTLVNEDARRNWTWNDAQKLNINAGAWGYDDDEPTVSGEVLIPIDREINDRFVMNQGDKFIGIRDQYNLAPTATLEADDQYRASEYERGIQQIMDQNNVDQRTAENIFSIYARNSLKR